MSLPSSGIDVEEGRILLKYPLETTIFLGAKGSMSEVNQVNRKDFPCLISENFML